MRFFPRGLGVAFALGLVLLAPPILGQSFAADEAFAANDGPPDIEVFTRAGCPHCAAAKLFLAGLQAERPGLRIPVHDVGKDPGALDRLRSLAERHGSPPLGVPAFLLRGELIIGFAGPDTTGARIKAIVDQPAPHEPGQAARDVCRAERLAPCDQERMGPARPVEAIDTPLFGRVSVQDLGLPLFTLAIGLLDGFNPCAMWVLLFLLSLLATLQDRTKMALIAGTFIVVSGLVYFAFMAAWLNAFLLIGFSRTVQIMLGSIAMLVGAVHVKDFFAFGKGFTLSIPEAAKPGLYARVRGILQAENLAGALAGIVVLALLVNAVELLCTAGFPALYTQILTLRRLPWWEYYGYLGLYNVAYMLDDTVMVVIAVITLGRRKLQEREGRWLKLLGGLVMAGLGAVLLAKPDWLTW